MRDYGRCPRCGAVGLGMSRDGSHVVCGAGCGFRLRMAVGVARLTDTQARSLLSEGHVSLAGVRTAKGAAVSGLRLDGSSPHGWRPEFERVPGPRRSRGDG